MAETRMLDEPDLFLSLNTREGGGSLGHTCTSNTSVRGSSLQLHDIQCLPYNSQVFNHTRSSVKSRVLGLNVGDIKARKWYLVVILLLYIGLITSFCLNISLLLRTYPKPSDSLQQTNRAVIKSKGPWPSARPELDPPPHSSKREYVYSTACLVEDPCEAGNYYSCSARSCLPCQLGTFQPVWGQTSCWSCPPNTTTDTTSSSSPAQCKQTQCLHTSRPGLAILQSPNYPGPLPANTNCHWRVGPGQGVSVLLIIPSLSLPPDCSHTLTVRRGAHTVFSSCQSTEGPLLLTSQGAGEMWVDFRTNNNLTGLSVDSTGFQLSLVSVSEDMRQVIDTVTDTFSDSLISANKQADQQLVRHIIKLLSAKVGSEKAAPSGAELPKIAGENSLLTVVEESDHYDYPYNDS